MLRHIANLLLLILPPTRFFLLKRLILLATGVKVGVGTRVCGGVQFFGGGKVIIGKECWIGLNARFYTSVDTVIEIGDCCDIAPDTTFMTGSHLIGHTSRRAGSGYGKSISVGKGTWIGMRTTVLPGSEIGDGCVVGAGTLVLGRKYNEDCLYAGIPASMKKVLDT